MSSQTVTVSVPGTGKELVLETDPATGRTSGRVDGRAVMRPLAANEEEREFKVDGQDFILRRLDGGGFDVDIAPSTFATGRNWTPAPSMPIPPPPKSSSSGGRTVGGIVITVLLLFGGRVAFRTIAKYMRTSGGAIEVTRFTCEPSGREHFEATVDLKNLSSDPLELTGHVTVIGMARSQIREFEAKVDPSPLAPDATGRFVIRDYMPESFRFGSGECRLDDFTDAAGKRIAYQKVARN